MRGGRRERDDAGGEGEQGGERTGRGAFSEGRCAFASGAGRRRENRGQWEREGALCAHHKKRRYTSKMRAGMHLMRRLQLPMRT